MTKVYFQDKEVQVIDELGDNIIVRLDGQNVCVAKKDLKVVKSKPKKVEAEEEPAEEPKPKKTKKKVEDVG